MHTKAVVIVLLMMAVEAIGCAQSGSRPMPASYPEAVSHRPSLSRDVIERLEPGKSVKTSELVGYYVGRGLTCDEAVAATREVAGRISACTKMSNTCAETCGSGSGCTIQCSEAQRQCFSRLGD